MTIANDIARLVVEMESEAGSLTDCGDVTKDLCLVRFLQSKTKAERAVFFTESTEVFDPINYVGDECAMGQQVMACLFITMDGEIGADVAAEIRGIRNQSLIEDRQIARAEHSAEHSAEWRARA